MATPFVQGRLREERLEVTAITACSQTGRELRLVIDSELDIQVLSPGARPYLFEPHLDWQAFAAPSIIHDY